jgi:hypothetical protein
VVGINEDGEEVTGGLVVETPIRPAGESGRPQSMTDRQLRVLQELRKEAATTGKRDFTTKEFNELCDRSGVVDIESPGGSQRRLRHSLKMQLANKGLITIAERTVWLVALS